MFPRDSSPWHKARRDVPPSLMVLQYHFAGIRYAQTVLPPVGRPKLRGSWANAGSVIDGVFGLGRANGAWPREGEMAFGPGEFHRPYPSAKTARWDSLKQCILTGASRPANGGVCFGNLREFPRFLIQEGNAQKEIPPLRWWEVAFRMLPGDTGV